VTVGPIRFDQTATAEHIADALCAGHHSIDLPLKTAVSLSARFPWLTPAGWFEIRDGSAPCGTRTGRGRLYLADGGYFENSGLETAIEIASLLRSLQAEYPDLKTEFPFGIEVKIIMIFSSDRPVWAPSYVESASAGELSAPIQTLLATRTARTRAVHLQAILEHRDLPAFKDRDQVRRYPIRGSKIIRTGIDDIHQVALDRSKFNLPLGWVLSTRSLEEIQKNDDKSAQLAFDLVEAELSGESTDDVKRAGSAE
jgi:hypothetical protein